MKTVTYCGRVRTLVIPDFSKMSRTYDPATMDSCAAADLNHLTRDVHRAFKVPSTTEVSTPFGCITREKWNAIQRAPVQ